MCYISWDNLRGDESYYRKRGYQTATSFPKNTILKRIIWHYKIFCVNGKYGIQVEFRIFYFIALQNEEDYERKESSSA